MNKKGKLLAKIVGLYLCALLVYLAHRYFLLPLFDGNNLEFVNFSYIFNLLASLLFIGVAFMVAHYTTKVLGFIFMAFGILKLLLFVLVAGMFGFSLERSVFLHFFVPYVLGLGIEIYGYTQLLKEHNPNGTNALE